MLEVGPGVEIQPANGLRPLRDRPIMPPRFRTTLHAGFTALDVDLIDGPEDLASERTPGSVVLAHVSCQVRTRTDLWSQRRCPAPVDLNPGLTENVEGIWPIS